ncbi:hypothetical protein PMAYCL1PPCAC_09953, partial [Pristionchus mayeri]
QGVLLFFLQLFQNCALVCFAWHCSIFKFQKLTAILATMMTFWMMSSGSSGRRAVAARRPVKSNNILRRSSCSYCGIFDPNWTCPLEIEWKELNQASKKVSLSTVLIPCGVLMLIGVSLAALAPENWFEFAVAAFSGLIVMYL